MEKETHGGFQRSSSSSLLRSRPSFKLLESSSSLLEQHRWPMETLIDCLSQMGSLSEAKETVRRGLIKNIKSVIASVMQRVKKEENQKQDASTFGKTLFLAVLQEVSFVLVYSTVLSFFTRTIFCIHLQYCCLSIDRICVL